MRAGEKLPMFEENSLKFGSEEARGDSSDVCPSVIHLLLNPCLRAGEENTYAFEVVIASELCGDPGDQVTYAEKRSEIEKLAYKPQNTTNRLMDP